MSCCTACNATPCQCYNPLIIAPCDPCSDTTACKIKVPAQCVTINNTTLDLFLAPSTILTYIYNAIIANPTQYTRFCELWAAC